MIKGKKPVLSVLLIVGESPSIAASMSTRRRAMAAPAAPPPAKKSKTKDDRGDRVAKTMLKRLEADVEARPLPNTVEAADPKLAKKKAKAKAQRSGEIKAKRKKLLRTDVRPSAFLGQAQREVCDDMSSKRHRSRRNAAAATPPPHRRRRTAMSPRCYQRYSPQRLAPAPPLPPLPRPTEPASSSPHCPPFQVRQEKQTAKRFKRSVHMLSRSTGGDAAKEVMAELMQRR